MRVLALTIDRVIDQVLAYKIIFKIKIKLLLMYKINKMFLISPTISINKSLHVF